jgi:hypothetical protein
MRKPVQNSPTADIQKLKIKVGRKPFDQHFDGNDFAACCFHNEGTPLVPMKLSL